MDQLSCEGTPSQKLNRRNDENLRNEGGAFPCKLCNSFSWGRSYALEDKGRQPFRAAECAECGLFQVLYDWSLAGPIKVTTAFDQTTEDPVWYSEQELDAHKEKGEAFAVFLNSRGLLHGMRVLELGCGRGFFLTACARLGARSITGQEFRNTDIEYGKDTHGFSDLRTAPIADEAVWPSGEFDIVCSFDVLEHVHDLGEFIDHSIRVMKPGGTLFHATPGFDSLSHRIGRFTTRVGCKTVGRVLCNVQHVDNLLGGPHVSILGREQLNWVARRHGLVVKVARYMSSYSYSNEHYANVVPGLSALPVRASAALFGLVRATVKNKFVFLAQKTA